MPAKPIRFALVLHNHQPIGNFEHVFQQAYQDSYRPFLDVFSRYGSLRLSLHVSGSLMEWLDANHPDYVDRLAELAARGRLEILGGAFYEPILAMIPSRDRIGQIRAYTGWLEARLGVTVRGMWVPERVWEQSFPRDLVEAGMEYTVLDDSHFKSAGLAEAQLHGSYLTEDDGRVMLVFPGSERLRYLIPFADPDQTIQYLRRIAEEHADAVVVFGDDGEKFGTWPQTNRHVYHDGWLERFFEALVANQDWIQVTTLAEAADHVPPLGKIYLPDASYREMTEWVLPVERQVEYERICQDLSEDLRWPTIRRFLRGGNWRNFRVRYPEADEMYARMMSVSRRLAQLADQGAAGELIEQARTELYRGQCNCAYWHGAFGGLYLPHLRSAVYRHLIAADDLLDQAVRGAEPWVEATIEDYNFDARHEVRLANDRLIAFAAPSRGGQLYELDVRAIRHNLLATLARRPEAYHRKVLAGTSRGHEQVASIHDRVLFKQEGLDKRLQYDPYLRKSLLDHFFDGEATLEGVAAGQAPQRGDFVSGPFEARVRRNPDRVQLLLVRQGNAGGLPLRLTKGLSLSAGSSTLEIAYMLEGIPSGHTLHFAVEFNFAGLPAEADDRWFRDLKQKRLGHLGSRLKLADVRGLGLVDQWLGIDVGLSASRPTHFWTFPVETVSQSEGGFELVHQSVVVMPHWFVTADAQGRWSVTLHLALDTSLAQSRLDRRALAAAT
ncbi:MAG: alpha-amylase/4-alpha-glucanotransferase domain-containing protein [Thermoguttaceae bacterium]